MNFQQIRDFVNPAVGQATGIEPVETLAMPVPAAHLMQAGGGGGSITVDSELSETSTNPVENRVITAALKSVGYGLYFIIHVEPNRDEESESQYNIDKTFDEISQALLSDKIPVMIYRDVDEESGEIVTQLYNYFGFYRSPSVIGFYYVYMDLYTSTASIIYSTLEIDENNEVTAHRFSVPATELP